MIHARDPAFDRVATWSDVDGDRSPESGEIGAIRTSGLVAITLTHSDEPRCDARDDCERQRGRPTYRMGAGSFRQGWVVEVTLAIR